MKKKISKTKINKKMKKKISPDLVETIFFAKKNNNWLEIAKIISAPRRKKISVNLEKIDSDTSNGDTVVIPGKVLGVGEINEGKKIKVCALQFSESAKEKLDKRKCEAVTILEEIKKNPRAQGIKLIK